MRDKFEVSFNSPQCGWMSIGFKHGQTEFNTTTAHAPYTTALSEFLRIAAELAVTHKIYKSVLTWNRDPEEYRFIFNSNGQTAEIQIYEYPTKMKEQGELVFEYSGSAIQIAKAFELTFRQMYDERDIDYFEENWHQEFPVEEYGNLKRAIEQHG